MAGKNAQQGKTACTAVGTALRHWGMRTPAVVLLQALVDVEFEACVGEYAAQCGPNAPIEPQNALLLHCGRQHTAYRWPVMSPQQCHAATWRKGIGWCQPAAFYYACLDSD